ncbi:hypothetical protein TB1_012954 [Malus domestica]
MSVLFHFFHFRRESAKPTKSAETKNLQLSVFHLSGWRLSTNFAKPATHVYHYHSNSWFHECAKWYDLNRRFIVSSIDSGRQRSLCPIITSRMIKSPDSSRPSRSSANLHRPPHRLNPNPNASPNPQLANPSIDSLFDQATLICKSIARKVFLHESYQEYNFCTKLCHINSKP